MIDVPRIRVDLSDKGLAELRAQSLNSNPDPDGPRYILNQILLQLLDALIEAKKHAAEDTMTLLELSGQNAELTSERDVLRREYKNALSRD